MAIDAWHGQFHQDWALITADVVTYVYDNTISNSGLRKIVVEAFTMTKDSKKVIDDESAEYPSRFLRVVIIRLDEVSTVGLRRRIGKADWKEMHLCRFHVSKGDENCAWEPHSYEKGARV